MKNKREIVDELTIVVEGRKDMELIRVLLPQDILDRTKFFICGGSASILSTARSVLLKDEWRKVLILMDLDARDIKIEEVQYYLGKSASLERFKVLLFRPSIEVLFLAKKEIWEEIRGIKISEEEFKKLKENPLKAIREMSLDENQTSIWEKISESAKKALLRTKELKEIMSFARIVEGSF